MMSLPPSLPPTQLLGGLLEVNRGYVRDIEQMGLASQFFDFLSLEHANNNVHNIRLCRQVVSAGTMTASELLELQVLHIWLYMDDRNMFIHYFIEFIHEFTQSLVFHHLPSHQGCQSVSVL